jgi:hypothetical protein
MFMQRSCSIDVWETGEKVSREFDRITNWPRYNKHLKKVEEAYGKCKRRLSSDSRTCHCQPQHRPRCFGFVDIMIQIGLRIHLGSSSLLRCVAISSNLCALSRISGQVFENNHGYNAHANLQRPFPLPSQFSLY